MRCNLKYALIFLIQRDIAFSGDISLLLLVLMQANINYVLKYKFISEYKIKQDTCNHFTSIFVLILIRKHMSKAYLRGLKDVQ